MQAYSQNDPLQQRHERGIRLILAVLTLGLFATSSQAESSQAEEAQQQATENATLPGAVEIEADSLDFQLERKMRAKGKAIIRKDGQEFKGDELKYDAQNDELQAEGHVEITGDQTEIRGPALKMKLKEKIGEMPNVSMEFKADAATSNSTTPPQPLLSDQAIFISDQHYLDDDEASSTLIRRSPFENSRATARQLLFEGQDKKTLKGASYTTCAANTDDWYIKAGSMELNDYSRTGVAKNAYVEFQGMPILYTPWMSFSYNNQRKSGFLSPLIGSTSRSGFEVLTPYYFNIRPDMDATISSRYLSKRGEQIQGELRYIDENYSGIDTVEYLNSDSVTGDSRYYIKLTHNQKLGGNWSAGFNAEEVSDDRYFSEMSSRIVRTSRVNLPRQAFINYSDEHWSFRGLVQSFQNLDNESYPYQRLPQLKLSYKNEWNGFTTYDYAEVVYFDKLSAASVRATGMRGTFSPSIAYPMKTSFGYVTPKVTVHSSYYDLNDNTPSGYSEQFNQLNRTVPMYSIDSGMFLDNETSLFGSGFKQTIEPRLFYVYIPYRDQSKFPVFDSARKTLNLDSLFSENPFAGNDRISNANQVTMAVTSRLIDTDTGIERFAATVGQQYYLSDNKVFLPSETNSNSHRSSVLTGLTARLSNRLNLDTFLQYDPNQARMLRSNFLIRYNPEPGKSFDFGYRRTVDMLDQINASGQWPLGNRWYALGRYNYSLYDSKTVESLAGLEYDAGCWLGRFVMQRVATATAEANTAIFFQLELGGLTSIGANPMRTILRDVPSYMRSTDIPSVYRDQNAQ